MIRFNRWVHRITGALLLTGMISAGLGCANAAAMEEKLIGGSDARTLFYMNYLLFIQAQQNACTRAGMSQSACSSAQSNCNLLVGIISTSFEDNLMYSEHAVNSCFEAGVLTSLISSSNPCNNTLFIASCVDSIRPYGIGHRLTYLGQNVD